VASAADGTGDRQVLAFGLYGTLADPIAISSVNRSAIPFDTIGRQPELTVSCLDRLAAALAG
jgi:hypothetical protein